MISLRPLTRLVRFRSLPSQTTVLRHAHHHLGIRPSIRIGSALNPSHQMPDPRCECALRMGLFRVRYFCQDTTQLPDIKDPDVLNAFKDLMAISWDKLPHSVIVESKRALSKSTEDKASQEALANALRAAEAVEEFGGKIMSLKMELDDAIGGTGENVKPLSEEYVKALRTFYQRYASYLGSFGSEETYLRKKVETELGSKMIYLKMRCGGLESEWGKVTVLGTSGLAGSYVEQRA